MVVAQYDPTAYFVGQPSSAVDAIAMAGSNGAIGGNPEVVIQNDTSGSAARKTWDPSDSDGGMNSGLVAVQLDANLRTGISTWSVAGASTDPVTLSGPSAKTLDIIELYAGGQNFAGQVSWSSVEVKFYANGVLQESGSISEDPSVDAAASSTGVDEQVTEITPNSFADDEAIVTGYIKLACPDGTYPNADDLFIQALVLANGSATAPTLASGIVGTAASQRSFVPSLTVVFNEPVNFSSSSITLYQEPLNDDGSIDAGSAATDVTSSVSVSNPSGDNFTWVISAPTGTSLADGIYQLVLHGSQITDKATGTAAFNGGSDQIVSFDSVEAGGASNYFHVLFGDANGDGIVNATDYRAINSAYMSSVGNSDYNAALDFNQDGTINETDYDAFYNNFLMSLSY
jgi:hypothetical protein